MEDKKKYYCGGFFDGMATVVILAGTLVLTVKVLVETGLWPVALLSGLGFAVVLVFVYRVGDFLEDAIHEKLERNRNRK